VKILLPLNAANVNFFRNLAVFKWLTKLYWKIISYTWEFNVFEQAFSLAIEPNWFWDASTLVKVFMDSVITALVHYKLGTVLDLLSSEVVFKTTRNKENYSGNRELWIQMCAFTWGETPSIFRLGGTLRLWGRSTWPKSTVKASHQTPKWPMSKTVISPGRVSTIVLRSYRRRGFVFPFSSGILIPWGVGLLPWPTQNFASVIRKDM